MNEVPTFQCGDYIFSVSGDRESVGTIVDIFADLSCAPVSDCFQWHFTSQGDLRSVQIDGDIPLGDVPSRLMPAQVVSLLTRQVLDHEPTLLHLHAAAVVEHEQALVVVGPSGAGKSTLCTALLAAGCSYVSDEMVAVHPDSLKVSSFAKPISVKKYAIGAVGRLGRIDAPRERNAPWLVPASTLGQLAAPKAHGVRTIVSYRYAHDEQTAIETLHRATMVRKLLADGQDAQRMGAQALVVASQLAVRANCLSATAGDAAALSASLRQVHTEAHLLGSLDLIGPADRGGAGPRRSGRVSSLILDGRALILDTDSDRIIELDESTSTWWALFDGTLLNLVAQEYAGALGVSPTETHDLAQAALDQLQELGVLAV